MPYPFVSAFTRQRRQGFAWTSAIKMFLEEESMDTKERVREFFLENAQRPLPNDELGFMACRYLDEGILDSMGIVLLVTEFEDAFGINFSAEAMQSYEFQTIGGLIGIIDGLRATKT